MARPLEYIISGHSGATEDVFEVPYNITLVFYADPNYTCYVPNDAKSMHTVLNEMQSNRSSPSPQSNRSSPSPQSNRSRSRSPRRTSTTVANL